LPKSQSTEYNGFVELCEAVIIFVVTRFQYRPKISKAEKIDKKIGEKVMDTKILEGKNLLVVDDEPDVVETIKELLEMCHIESAADFETGERLLNENRYDIAILDIMGVKGYDLLEIANKNRIPALMLTTHALTPDDLSKSVSEGAKAYIPKEKMNEIAVYLTDLMKAQAGKEKPHRWIARLKSFFDNRFEDDEWYKTYRELERKHGPFID
jgi:CheY-like chemotaxis protein